MHIHDYYYDAKPFIPWNLRMMARRLYLSGRRRNCHEVWPIKEDAGHPPVDWPGWPNGKKFAFVLTHDVEGQNGLQKCEQLMRMEQALGFRSCFNFIPEGEYIVPPELRALLAANDFEVGVHDLYHDGKLYRSREGFRRSAQQINKYLEAWDAVGFRSGFMHHNLEWLHDLHITYDCSTFDTDPFEPQPDGVSTIFPFWVEPQSSPSTLNPQPSTTKKLLRLRHLLLQFPAHLAAVAQHHRHPAGPFELCQNDHHHDRDGYRKDHAHHTPETAPEGQ
jgi:hypothetical protein